MSPVNRVTRLRACLRPLDSARCAQPAQVGIRRADVRVPEQVADVPEWEALLVELDCVRVPEPVWMDALLDAGTRCEPAKAEPS